MYAYIYMYVYVFTHTHTHTHIYRVYSTPGVPRGFSARAAHIYVYSHIYIHLYIDRVNLFFCPYLTVTRVNPNPLLG